MKRYKQFWGSIIGGAIGDALGGEFENQEKVSRDPALFVWGETKQPKPLVSLSDDTQLTMATCESIIAEQGVDAEKIAAQLLQWYQANRLSGLGSATYQALQGMAHGGHWALVGKKGERAAGNGAAMRIAPLAFWRNGVSREVLRDVCRITHHNDEAYVGALAIYLAIKDIVDGEKSMGDGGLAKIAYQLPDTRLRDRLEQLSTLSQSHSILEIGTSHGNSGYVVDSVPFALYCVVQSVEKGFEQVMCEIINSGGDTDTNASLFGQVAGAMLGYDQLPPKWVQLVEALDEYKWMEPILRRWEEELI